MKFFSSLTSSIITALVLASSVFAETSIIETVTCSRIDWSIILTQSDYQNADYARLVIFDNIANSEVVKSEQVFIRANGDIRSSGVSYSFYTNLVQTPVGTPWNIGVALYDASGYLINSDSTTVTYPNPCGSSYSSSSSSIVSTSTIIPGSSSTSVIPSSSTIPPAGPTNTDQSKTQQKSSSSQIPAIVGGVVGGVAFLLAAILFFFLRKRKAAKHAQEEQYGRDASMGEKGYPTGPMSAVSVLPHSQSYGTAGSGQEDVSRDGYYQSNVPPAPSTTTFSSPPTSPRMSAVTRPMSNFSQSNFSASPAPARGNNPLLNRQQVSNSGWTASGPLAEPM